mgnify:CR=1 FL=1
MKNRFLNLDFKQFFQIRFCFSLLTIDDERMEVHRVEEKDAFWFIDRSVFTRT